MNDAVIVAAVRTAVGKRGGALASIHPADLSAAVLTALVERTGIDPALVDDVIWGCVNQVGEQTFDIARTAIRSAGWPESVPGTTVDRQCGSSQQAVHFAAAGVASGQYDPVVAGGVESMPRVPIWSAATALDGQSPLGELCAERYGAAFPNQGIGAEMIAELWGLTRTQLDEFALTRGASLNRLFQSRCQMAPWSMSTRVCGKVAPSRSLQSWARRFGRMEWFLQGTARRLETVPRRC